MKIVIKMNSRHADAQQSHVVYGSKRDFSITKRRVQMAWVLDLDSNESLVAFVCM